MKADFYAHLPQGTLVRVPDESGRLATVVYHNLDGYGVRWGDVRSEEPAPPDAMLRDPYSTADYPCVGEDYDLAREEGEDEQAERKTRARLCVHLSGL